MGSAAALARLECSQISSGNNAQDLYEIELAYPHIASERAVVDAACKEAARERVFGGRRVDE
jgi:hypothetical protein